MHTRALVIEHFDDTPHIADLAVPDLASTEVLVRVHAASINAFDWKAASGMLRHNFTYTFPVTIGRDYSGVVEAVGSAVTTFAVGDEIFGYFTGTELRRGSYADYVWVDEDECFVPKPATLDHTSAACLPLSGVVALRCVDAVDPAVGETVLVVGAPGGVGSFAVQLLAAQGAHVIATGQAEDEKYLTGLGAAEVVRPGETLIPQIAQRYPDGIAGLVDVVHRGDDFVEHAGLVTDGGRVASLHWAAENEALAARGVTGTNVGSRPDTGLLTRLGDLAVAGDLQVTIEGTYPLEKAADGLAALKEQHARGKSAVATGAEP